MDTDAQVATTLSIIALAVSVVAALFTGWQAWSASGTRRDARSVHFVLVTNANYRVGAVRNMPQWNLENAGNGAAINPVVTIVYEHEHIRHEFIARVEGAVHGHSQVPLTFDREPPSAHVEVKDSSGMLAGEFLSATVRFGIPSSRRRRTERLKIGPQGSA